MNVSDLQMKLDFKSKIISKVSKFNRKYKAFSLLGTAYAFIVIFFYHIFLLFRNNTKKLTALFCIIVFLVLSSSFSYPAMSLDVSFENYNAEPEEVSTEDSSVISQIEVAESDAELAVVEEIKPTDVEEEGEIINPDVAEIDDMVSVSEILDESKNATEVEVSTEAEDSTEEKGTQETEGVPETEETPKAEDATDTRATTQTEAALALEQNMEPVEAENFESDDWNILLVNKQHPIPEDYDFNLGTISGGMKCDERIITPLFDMLRAANDDGVNLVICSPYRDMDRQTMLFSNKIDNYMENGMSYMDAYNLASQAVTVPGSSEHQIGLAVDIITDKYTTLDEGFGETAAGKWLAENSSDYGFILRYPKGKEEITSIEYEPWHFRYVGPDAARVITENDLCLEEFWNLYVE